MAIKKKTYAKNLWNMSRSAKKKTRKRTGMINLTTLRRLAKKAFGKDVRTVEENTDFKGTWILGTSGESGVGVEHTDRAVARRMLKAALDAALKG